ncbi:MAG: phage tail protein [Patulibacter sp.]|nr:phage tail protein [Patulibacter sp.]
MPYVGEIRMFGGNFAPVGWMLCQGQVLPISENEVLFQLIGTTYGGDGESTFRLPDLQGRLPVHQGQGPGITQSYIIGESFGVESVTLTTSQLPGHTHGFCATLNPGTTTNASGAVLASPPSITMFLRDAPGTSMSPQIVSPVGGSQPHENRSPIVVVNYIISLFGVFPSPS